MKAKKPEQNRQNILLVDDKESNLLTMEALLESSDYGIIKADSGPKALKQLLENDYVFLIILDVQMPVIDGFETAKLIRKREKNRYIPIIFVSAEKIEEKDIFHGYALGAFDYLTKPINPEILKSKVNVFLSLYQFKQDLGTAYEQLQQEIVVRRKAEEKVLAMNEELELRITERTKSLKKSNERLQEFAYVASHDLQEPLRMVINYMQLLEKKYKKNLDETADQYIHFAVDGAKRMQKLIQGLLALSRIDSRGEPFEAVDCDETVGQVLKQLKTKISESKASIKYKYLPSVVADRMQLGQLFQNIIENALKYRSNKKPQISVSAESKKHEWLFSITDNGIGIDPIQTKQIFAIFKRLHSKKSYPGTGIGLAICDRIIERHGGKIWVESNPNEGSTFFFTIPKTNESA